MSDPRLNSCHLGLCPRRADYRRARAVLLEERGCLTLAGEKACALLDAAEDWLPLAPARPDQFLPGTKYLLVDQRAACVYLLKVGLNTIGRLPNNDIVLEGLYTPRRHCVILVHVRGWCELHDTASRNGTFLNGRRLRAPVHVTSGDRIQVCDRPLFLVSE